MSLSSNSTSNSIINYWKNYSNSILLDTTESIDKCLNYLPILKKDYEYNNNWMYNTNSSYIYTETSSLWLIDELRDFSMSISVLERHISIFAENYYTNENNIDNIEINNSIVYNNIFKKGPYDWRYMSGIVSLLRLLNKTLNDVNNTLANLSKLTRWKVFLKNNIFASIFPFISIGIYYILKNSKLFSTLKQVLSPYFSRVGSSCSKIMIRLLQYFNIENRLPSALSGKIIIIVLSYYFYIHNYRKYCMHKLLKRLRFLHRRLSLLQRLWVVVNSTIHQRASFRLHVDDQVTPFSPDFPISMWLLSQLPPSLHLKNSFWYEEPWQLCCIKLKFDIAYASMAFTFAIFGSRPLFHWIFVAPVTIASAIYYSFRPNRAASRATDALTTPDYRLLKTVWSIFDIALSQIHSSSSILYDLYSKNLAGSKERILPPIAYCRNIFLNGFVHSDNLFYETAYLSPSFPQSISVLCSIYYPAILSIQKVDQLSSTINNRIIPSKSPQTLTIPKKSRKSLNGLTVNTNLPNNNSISLKSPRIFMERTDIYSTIKLSKSNNELSNLNNTIVLFLHGAGWITHLPGCERLLVSMWSELATARYVTVQYSLTPENCFPTALRECYETYRWILEGRLGFFPSKIIIVGDSVGGNLAAGVCLRCMEEGILLPNKIILAYPTLDLRPVVSPSRLLYIMDSFAPINLLQQFRSMYVSSQSDLNRNAYISPLIASDEQLKLFPSTCIIVAGIDPHSDDSILFAHRLEENGVSVQLQFFPELPHAFFNFCHFLPEAALGVNLVAKWINEK